jgi:hypothetical protein
MSRYVVKESAPDDVWLTKSGVYRRGKVDGRLTATMSCPECGKPASLSGHTIAPDGDVSPSVVCPHDGCHFHEYVMLLGWDMRRTPWPTPPAQPHPEPTEPSDGE